ncbi:putative sphingosine kinase A, B [Leishmania major strain Friedlin]|uniref:Putative sphingosine kinase A, B n=1 Tax=Leishmania major TaxID=5664 RepID=Q4Q9C3_LEIMA|nr:putative sphingosine kinase A, B [Leishmania major strain Friedlin]CAG9576368.1 sphingosine_kinase_A_-_B_-_putative [Leishmania major strain Friedlin]CAJ04865.1 putative sphingosine kinase A, B [Leishmania major strain Friedlin]|eukprot:XP_001684075.1 putative sphingosine kinase A, B [Leishmania major strain Friedlin]
MHSLSSNNTPSPHPATHRHTNHSSTHTSSLLPPTASPVLQASCMSAKEDHIGADAQGIPSSALFTPKPRIFAVPASTESPPSPGATCHHAPTGGINVSAATGVSAAHHSDSGSNTAAPTASSSSPALQKQQPEHCVPAAYRGKLDDAPHAVDDNMEAVILSKGRICTLAYFPSRGSFRITHVSSNGKTRVVFNIPVRMIINIETAAERDARQRARQANDDTIKLVFAESGRNTRSLLCSFPSGAGEDNEGVVLAHSVNTASLTLSLLGGPPPTPTASHFGAHTAACAAATAAPSIRYYVHYVQQRNKENPSIRTLEFQSSGPAETVQHVVSTVVQHIYQKGSKHIIAFISAKSGKGKGEHIFEKHVRPLLHFSRHTYQAHVTRRAHDCEDYVANLENPMDSNTVIAAVGGDGMIHETVNGVHRRKLALVRWLRSVTANVSTGNGSVVSPDLSVHLNEERCAAVLLKSGSANKVVHHGEASVDSPSSPFIELGCEENKRDGYGGNGVTPSAEATAREAYRLARCLVQGGWDALMPLVATVATGSACGLAKSLDVLSVTEAALSLVHLSTVHMDLLLLNFTPNEDMVEFHRCRMSSRRLDAAQREFSRYKEDKAAELQERSRLGEAPQLPPRTLTAADCMTPFLKDGSNVYRDAVSCAMRMPELHSRVAFMSLSFGSANDIDHGSESLRWMGNARFQVYGGYMILRGLKRYKGMLRYLPWGSKAGKTVEKLHTRCKMPSTDDFPLCTMRESCPHCRQYVFVHCGAPSLSSIQGDDTHPGPTPNTSRSTAQPISAAEVLAPYTDQQLLDEDVVDFKDERLPWVTVRGDFCIALLCNVRDVAQDMLMAPLAHMSDGAIDIVYCRVDPITGRGGRMEMLKFVIGLESGSHVNLDFVNYVKARALEIKVDAGISMSDGELMPLSSVRVTKMRGSVQFVRSG